MAFTQALHYAPLLQSLTFPPFPGCWDWIHRLTTLRHLTLGFTWEEELPDALPTVHEVDNSLRHLTSLQTLNPGCQFRTHDPGAHLTGNSVPFPSVTELVLSGTAVHCVDVITHLTFPSFLEARFSRMHCEAEDVEIVAGALVPILLTVNSRP